MYPYKKQWIFGTFCLVFRKYKKVTIHKIVVYTTLQHASPLWVVGKYDKFTMHSIVHNVLKCHHISNWHNEIQIIYMALVDNK